MSAKPHARSPAVALPGPSDTALFVCDIQGCFAKPMERVLPELLLNSTFLIKAADVLALPIIVTEQYPERLGGSMDPIKAALDSVKSPSSRPAVFAKTLFSMLTPEVEESLVARKSSNVILVGMEAHVCVLQTANDLALKGYNVYIVADAIVSQNPRDREIALDRMRDLGCIVTSAESVVFQLMQHSKHSKFKDISALVKQRIEDRKGIPATSSAL